MERCYVFRSGSSTRYLVPFGQLTIQDARTQTARIEFDCVVGSSPTLVLRVRAPQDSVYIS